MALTYETDEHICSITLNRPKALNAFDREMLQESADACARFRDDTSLWAAIIMGAGNQAFSPPWSISWTSSPRCSMIRPRVATRPRPRSCAVRTFPSR